MFFFKITSVRSSRGFIFKVLDSCTANLGLIPCGTHVSYWWHQEGREPSRTAPMLWNKSHCTIGQCKTSPKTNHTVVRNGPYSLSRIQFVGCHVFLAPAPHPQNLYQSQYTACELSCVYIHKQNKQEAQLMLTTGSTRLAVSRGQQTWYHSTCYI